MVTNRKEKRNERALKTIRNSKAMKEDRWAAIEYFKDLEDVASAVPALLQRFEYSLEHGIIDTREKELAMEGIKKHNKASVPFILEHLKSTNRIAWPIKALNATGDQAEVITCLKAALNFGDNSFDRDIVDKNYDVLCYLRDYQLQEFSHEIAHFLRDADERVRFAAVEVLIEQDDKKIPEFLEEFLHDQSSENRRIRRVVIDAFAEKKWPVQKPEAFSTSELEPGTILTKQKTIQKTT